MIGKLVLIALAATSTPPGPGAGQVTATVGRVTILRGDRLYLAGPGAAVEEGDRLETAPGGSAGIFLDGAQVLALGPATSATVRGPAEGRVVALDRGEARLTAGGEAPVAVAVGTTRVRIRRGILRASAEGPRFLAERGAAEVVAAGRAPIRLEEGREVAVPRGVATLVSGPGGPRGWSIRPEDLRLAGMASASLARQGVGGREVVGPPVLPPAANPGRPPVPAPVRARPTIPPPPDEAAPPTRSAIPPPPAEDVNRATPGQPTAPEDNAAAADRPYQPIAVAQPTSVSTIALDLGSISASSSAATSGALFSDAQQDSRNLAFPGNIHLVTAQSRYLLSDVKLRPGDLFPATTQYWSIGIGTPPTGQVSTDFRTGTNPTPTTIPIPRTDAYLVRLDQFGIKDPATVANPTDPNSSTVGIFGLLGRDPIAPQVRGARPLLDSRAHFNDRATFALGDLALETQGNHPVLDVRRSDQDRQILKDPGGNDDKDRVTPNPDVNFTRARDAKFFPEVPLVFVPAPSQPGQPTVRNAPTYGGLDLTRKAAAITLLADSLSGFARRTGQTRFVVDNQVVDITGYTRAGVGLMRSGHAEPGMGGGPVAARHAKVAAAHRHR